MEHRRAALSGPDEASSEPRFAGDGLADIGWRRSEKMIERMDTARRMSKIVKHGGTVYLCGQVGDGASVAEQTRDCLGRVEALLARAGSSKEKILQAIIWLADMSDFAEMNGVWDAWVPEGHAPARACGEARLARSDLRVEIIVTAACD
jgi:enamine deaminase RidA (YjgF/YER057c/UK114 family)